MILHHFSLLYVLIVISAGGLGDCWVVGVWSAPNKNESPRAAQADRVVRCVRCAASCTPSFQPPPPLPSVLCSHYSYSFTESALYSASLEHTLEPQATL